jgi:phosphoribosyl 1,2-cyclic phosphodiesterase
VLASGSAGNAALLRSGDTTVLIDAGISARELSRRLAASSLADARVDALLLSHEHNDHVRGAAAISRRMRCPVYANRATSSGAGLLRALESGALVDFKTGYPFTVGCLEVTPFPLPHDAAETVGFTVWDGRVRAGFATDLGSLTFDVLAGLSGCDLVVLESNHDEAMLMEGPYPEFLKQRVSSRYGHLSNSDAAQLAHSLVHEGMRHLVLAHLSRTNNLPDLPLEAVRGALGPRCSKVSVTLGWQYRAGELITL